ncbi:MAG: hypothetical protein J5I90_06470 [Caldilineales bacterium]|nr:hypothetical protein [Caldilineales bacterium]
MSAEQVKRLTAELEAARQELAEVSEAKRTNDEDLRQLEDSAAADLAGAQLSQLRAAAKRRAQSEVDLIAARATAEELARRIAETKATIAALEQRLSNVWMAEEQKALDVNALAITEQLQKLVDMIDAQRADEDRVHRQFGKTPHVWYSTQFREHLNNRLDFFRREFQARNAA